MIYLKIIYFVIQRFKFINKIWDDKISKIENLIFSISNFAKEGRGLQNLSIFR